MLPFMSDYSKKNQSYKLGGGIGFAPIVLKEPPRLVYMIDMKNEKLSIRGLFPIPILNIHFYF